MYLYLIYTYSPIHLYKVHPLINTIRHFSQCSPTSKVRGSVQSMRLGARREDVPWDQLPGLRWRAVPAMPRWCWDGFFHGCLSERGNLGRLGRWDPASGNVGTIQISREPVGNLLGRFARFANCCSLASPRTRRKSTAAVRIIVIGTPWRHRKCALMPRLVRSGERVWQRSLMKAGRVRSIYF